MRKLYKLSLGICAMLPLMASCEKDLPIYSNEACGLEFEYEYTRDSVYNYSFAFGPSNVEVDTVKFEVNLLGNVVDYDRPISLQQVMTGSNDAQVGIHYVSFDDPSLTDKYVLPANAISTEIPIVLLRDPSLKQNDYKLKITFKDNEAFTFTAKEHAYRSVIIADQLIKPTNWENYACSHFLGTYGPVKHQFMIDVTGYPWDNEFVDNQYYTWLQTDQNILFRLQNELQAAVDEYNATHDEPLREPEEYDYAEVKFKLY